MTHSLAFISPGGGELILIMLVLIMLFGAKDAPRILRKFQSFMDEIRRIANGFRYDMMYSDMHAGESESAQPQFDNEEIEEGDFEQYDFEEDYGYSDEADEPETDDEPEDTDEVSKKTDQ